jgi:hypothetical protein
VSLWFRRFAPHGAIVAMVFLAVLPGPARAGWREPVSQPLNAVPGQPASAPVIATIGTTPTAAWSESNGSTTQVRVAQLGNGFWTPLGNSLNTQATNDAQSPAIATVAGTLEVAFSENMSGTSKIVVKAFDGSSWNPVGVPFTALGGGSGGAFVPSIASFGNLNPLPRVAWSEVNGGVPQIYVADYSIANGFQNVGSGQPLNVNATHSAFNPKLANVGGTAYVTWSENGAASQVFVKKLAGGAWSAAGAQPLNADPTHNAGNPSIASIGGAPYVAWSESATGAGTEIRVARLTGSSWTPVGNPLNLSPGLDASGPSITSIGGVPFLAWTQGTGAAKQVRVAQLSGSDWTLVGPPVNVSETEDGDNPSLGSVGGVPYVGFREVTSTVGTARVSRLEPDFLSHSSIATDTGALLVARVRDYGVALPVGFEFGPGAGFGTTSSLQNTTGAGSDTLTQSISGLAAASGYSWRAFGSDSARKTGIGPTQTFTTQAAATGPAGPQGPQGQAGPQGPTGARGPAGRDAKVTCRIKRIKKKQKVACTVTLVRGSNRPANARLVRRGRTYAEGRLDRRGQLRMRVVRRLTAGRYTLELTRHGRAGVNTVERHEVKIK